MSARASAFAVTVGEGDDLDSRAANGKLISDLVADAGAGSVS
jgi:hypothetical protein